MITDRLKQFIEEKGDSIYAFERNIGASTGSIAKAIKGKKNIGSQIVENILNHYTDLNVKWLFTGHGDMFVDDYRSSDGLSANEKPTTYKLSTDNDLQSQQIPLYNLEATAGLVSLFEKHSDSVPIDFIKIPNLPKCDGALSVAGDSMYPLLKSGDIIAYKEIKDLKNDIFWGEMYLVSMNVADDEYIAVKWVQRSDLGDDYIKLVSENRHHEPKDIHIKHINAMAIVKASIRINSMR